MKMQLDTIPLWDSFRAGGECPMCSLHKYLEDAYLDVTLGGAAMDPDIRIMSNEKGYCAYHFKALFDMGQRLPLALITHTHLLETTEKLRAVTETAMKPESSKRGLFGKRTSDDPLDEVIRLASGADGSCMICERVSTTMKRYAETVMYLYKKDNEFADLYRNGQGFCLEHYAQLLKTAQKELSGNVRDSFIRDTLEQETRALDRLGDELKQFTLMFDYRNSGKDWGTSRDALPRTIQKLRGGRRPDDLELPGQPLQKK